MLPSGDESLAAELRDATAKELQNHAQLYSTHAHVIRTSLQLQIPEDVLWQSLLGSSASFIMDSTPGSLLRAVQMEGTQASRFGEHSCMLHVFALSTVLQADIVSVCPSTNFAHRSLLHAILT